MKYEVDFKRHVTGLLRPSNLYAVMFIDKDDPEGQRVEMFKADNDEALQEEVMDELVGTDDEAEGYDERLRKFWDAWGVTILYTEIGTIGTEQS